MHLERALLYAYDCFLEFVKWMNASLYFMENTEETGEYCCRFHSERERVLAP